MKFLLPILFFTNLHAQNLSGNFSLESSKIDYLVKYLIKKADGTSSTAKGKGECKIDKCEFIIAAPLKSFESKDANRDINMLNTTKAEKFPLVSAHVLMNSEIKDGKTIADFEVEMGGIKKTYSKVPMMIKTSEKGFSAEGSFDLFLDDHKIEKPSLLGVSIENIVPIHFSAQWQKS